MAQQYTLDTGEVVTIPATYTNTQVKTTQVGTVGSGVVAIIGEADEGPAYSEEESLDDNSFSPDELSSVITKYGSGRLVDAFRVLTAPSSDAAIPGSVSAVKIVKTNTSVKATSAVSRAGLGQYAVLAARRAGLPGNAIQYKTSDYVAEVAPTSGQFAFIPHYSGADVDFAIGVNGVQIPMSIAERSGAEQIVVDFSKGASITGITRKLPLNGLSNSIALVATGAEVVTITTTVAFAETIAVGDVMVIPKATPDFIGVTNASSLLGAADANEGAYIVTSVATNGLSFTMTRINKPSGTGVAASVSSVPNATYEDIIQYKPMTISVVQGMDRESLVGLSGSFGFVVNGSSVVISAPSDFASLPAVNDIVRVAADISTAMLKGFYRVTAASAASITCVRLSDGSAGVSGSHSVASPMTASTQIFKVEKPSIDGLGKALEINGDISSISRKLDGTASALSDSVIVSTVEQKNTTQIINRLTNVTEQFDVGGEIVLSMATTNSNASVVISSSSAAFTSSAGTFTVNFSVYKNLQALVDYINTQSGYAASLVKPSYAVLPPSVLDEGTYSLSSGSVSRKVCRIKYDAYQWENKVGASTLTTVTMVEAAGLPEAMSAFSFLSGGAKGGTLAADVVSAIDACEGITTNFIVPLFSKDATADITDEETEATSTYEIDAINTYANAHAIKMSKVKARRHRIAVVSKSDTYENQKTASSSLNSFRCGFAFQDVKTYDSEGTIKQFQPWMTAIIAAGMQAAAGYRGIVKKQANVSAVIKSDFDSRNDANLEDALQSGLLILERIPTGGFRWVSDQLTYSTDNNFVYNSLQAVYVSDLMTLTLNANFDLAVIGKSITEMTAAGAASLVEAQMEDFFRLKWIAPSDDAPMGYKNLTVRLVGGVLSIGIEVKLAGLIYFCPINLVVSEVTQTA